MKINLEEFLQKKFQFANFRPGQKEVISSVLAGVHTVAMLPTGTGKSLCYHFPGYLLEGQVIVVSPLLSLMQDQVEQLKIMGEKRVCAINSFLTPREKYAVLSRLDRYKFIYVSPEMLHGERVLNSLKKLSPALFVVDEAHCISQWGYDFRPEYMKLGRIRKELGNPLTLTLTATATRPVIDDIICSLHLEEWQEYIYSVDRPNISLAVEIFNDGNEKLKRLFELTHFLRGPGIIYFSSKKMAEETAVALKDRGMDGVEAYHAGMDQESRVLIQQQFIKGQLQCICATSAFGMGINKDNVRYVIHFHMPLQPESYLQEIGRAGRDGDESIAILLYSPGDDALLDQLIQSEYPDKEQLDAFIQFLMQNPGAAADLRSYGQEICQAAGLTETQWRVTGDFYESRDFPNLDRFIAEFTLFIDNRKQFKQEKLKQMKAYVYSKNCRRERLLEYFAEKGAIKNNRCCDLCGMTLEPFIGNNVPSNFHGKTTVFDWRSHLAAILLES